MWLKITGTLALPLSNLAQEAGLMVTEHLPGYHLHVDAKPRLSCPVVDGVDCELERAIVNHIAALTPSGKVLLQRGGGVQSDREASISIPDTHGEIEKCCLGIVRGLLEYRDRKQPWYARLLR